MSMSKPLRAAVEHAPSLQTAHVLFLDIVSFTKLRTDEQVSAQVELSRLVQNTSEVSSVRADREQFLVRPTGDGMALLFFKDLLSPLRCALQLSQAIAERNSPFGVRMGVHSGPVSLVTDMNGQADAAGDGIIRAQRVMDMGDAGHILLSGEIARTLLTLDPWPRYLSDLGVVRVKHQQEVHLYNLYGRLDGPFCGNAALPSKVREDGNAQRREARIPLSARLQPYRRLLAASMAILGIAGGGWAVWSKNPASVRTAVASLETRLGPALRPGKSAPRKKPAKVAKKSGGSQKPRGEPVAVASGEAIERVSVPRLRKLSLEEATSLAEVRGLQLVERGPRVVKSGYDEGTVFFQSVPAGKRAKAGAIVYVRVAAWPEEKVVAEETPTSGLADPSSDVAEAPAEE